MVAKEKPLYFRDFSFMTLNVKRKLQANSFLLPIFLSTETSQIFVIVKCGYYAKSIIQRQCRIEENHT
jgi:hypothetical protein